MKLSRGEVAELLDPYSGKCMEALRQDGVKSALPFGCRKAEDRFSTQPARARPPTHVPRVPRHSQRPEPNCFYSVASQECATGCVAYELR